MKRRAIGLHRGRAPVAGNVRHQPVNANVGVLLDQYITALNACLDSAKDIGDRNYIFERLSAADAMRTEILNANLGRAASILNDEMRTTGWSGFYGEGSEVMGQAFRRFADAVQSARLADRPDAGFGH